MNTVASISDLAQIIQLAVAPVFLLAGIAGFLNVMSIRLGRIIDRSRIVEAFFDTHSDEKILSNFAIELNFLKRRMTIIHRSISFCSISALLVCLLIVGLFIGESLELQITAIVIGLFVLSMLLLIAALILFLVEINLATQQLHPKRR
jgi:hypothetical protein